MRTILILWFVPIAFFWGWYGLSANDVNFGNIFLSRRFHDHMFVLYGNILGLPPAEVPAKIAAAFILDSALLLAIVAFRWRKSWYPQTSKWVREKIASFGEQESALPLVEDYHYGEPVITAHSADRARPAE